MKCKYCNNEIDDNAQFCPNCGMQVKQHAPTNTASSFDALNKKIALYKKLAVIVSIVLFLFVFLGWGIVSIVGIVVFTGIDIFLSTKIAKFNREKDTIKFNFSKAEKAPDTFEQEIMSDSINDLDAKADKNITKYLNLYNVCSTIATIGGIVFSLLLLFFPFFSVLIDDISIFKLAESSFIWNLSSDKEFFYADLLSCVLQEGLVCGYLCSLDIELAIFSLGLSISFFFILPVLFLIDVGRTFYKSNKYKTDVNFKNAIIYKYNNKKATSHMVLVVLSTISLVLIFLPAIDFCFCLPKYFTELTNQLYYVALFCYLCFFVFICIFPAVLGLKYKQASFALRPETR